MNLSCEKKYLQKKYKQILTKTFQEIKQSKNYEEIFEAVCEKRISMLSKRKAYKCNGCASCCKLAISEFSYEELTQKAQSGDNYSKQFIETFVPYENIDDAKKIYPEYFELLDQCEEKYYCYHCPKISDDNRCPDYENRPQICKDFPDNPIGFLPPKCAFNNWKKEVEDMALEIKAIYEIIEFFKTRS